MKKAILTLATLFALIPFTWAQSKQETKWYLKTKSAGTVAAYDNFIRRYPKSVYLKEIDSLKYEALFVTPMDNYEALEIITDLNPSLKADSNQGVDFFKAAPLRDNGRDFIVGVSVREEGLAFDKVKVYLSEKKNGIWQIPTSVEVEKPVTQNDMVVSFLHGDEEIVAIDGEKWLHFAFRSYNNDGEKIEHVEALLPVGEYAFDNQQPGFVSEIFSGSRLGGKRIEGMMPVFDSTANYSSASKYLLNRLKSDESLVQIAEEDYLSDQSMEWWMKNNPNVFSSAQSIKFGQLPENSSLVKAFKASREKERGEGWTAALFDIRGNTVVCAKSPAGAYVLVWCEPRFKDRATDRILNAIYFDKGANMSLFYYQGRKAFKYKLNLNSKTLTR